MATTHQIVTRRVFTGVMVLFALVFFYPVIFVILNAFKTDAQITVDPLGLPKGLFFGNFARAWTAMEFPRVFLNTFSITVLGLAGNIGRSMAAYKPPARTAGCPGNLRLFRAPYC